MTTSLNYCSVWGEKNMNTFIQQAYIKLIKKLYFLLQINYVILNFLFINDSWKKIYHGFHKNLKRDNFPVFKIDKYFDKVDKVIKIDKEKLFLEHQISTLEWFMKDRVTLKTLILIAIIFHNNAVFFIRLFIWKTHKKVLKSYSNLLHSLTDIAVTWPSDASKKCSVYFVRNSYKISIIYIYIYIYIYNLLLLQYLLRYRTYLRVDFLQKCEPHDSVMFWKQANKHKLFILWQMGEGNLFEEVLSIQFHKNKINKQIKLRWILLTVNSSYSCCNAHIQLIF